LGGEEPEKVGGFLLKSRTVDMFSHLRLLQGEISMLGQCLYELGLIYTALLLGEVTSARHRYMGASVRIGLIIPHSWKPISPSQHRLLMVSKEKTGEAISSSSLGI
jgi:hypothetical protein